MATRWGICSAGKISHDFSVALRTLNPEHHQIVAVAAREVQHAEDFAKKHKIPRAYGSYDELAKDPDVGTLQINHLGTGKLFMTHKKSVLIEKPLAMNSREVQDLIASAQDNSVFLMEAMWTRFFPLSYKLRKLLSQNDIGDVQIVKAEIGNSFSRTSRYVEKKLGGGALLVVGIYTLHFVFMVFNGEEPESIQAIGHCLDNGVDGTAVLVLKFSRNRLAVCTCSVTSSLSCDAVITGTKGTIKIPQNIWCPTTLMVNGTEMEFPLPEPGMPLNYTNSVGLRYEAEEVRRCLLEGLKESPEMPWAHSKLVAKTVDEAWRQMGVAYD